MPPSLCVLLGAFEGQRQSIKRLLRTSRPRHLLAPTATVISFCDRREWPTRADVGFPGRKQHHLPSLFSFLPLLLPTHPLFSIEIGWMFFLWLLEIPLQALMGIKASLVDPHSVLENWDKDSVDPCSWTMITCSSENLVVGLIALGAARGLLYLHEQCDPKIIHRDVKAANILLDDYCEAVVGDFGLAKLLDHRDTHVTTAVRGTVGHIAPEYLSTGQSSEKTDVFGFGILLLELITGLRAVEYGKAAKQKGAMLDWVCTIAQVKKMHQEKKLDVLVDKDLKNYDRIELEEMVQVALLCTQYLPGHRPKMSEVVRMLEGDGLAERWEASQRAEVHKFKAPEFSSERYSDLTDDSLLVEAMELSGPR
ncbi:hypothetical protein BHE74_00022492 [Ensete ventricosum]|nr:hypothetical protein BHE74_00022492 [Ensete ventricosum]